MSALHYAAHDGQLAIVRLLIAHGADAGARYPAHLGGAQPAAAARRRGDAELAAALEAAPPPPPSPSLGRQCTMNDVTTRASVSAGGGGGGLGWVIPPDCTELDLSRAGIDAEGARALGLALRRNNGGGGLTALRLPHNQIGDDGARAIANALGGDLPALGEDPRPAGTAATPGTEGRRVSLLDLSANGLTAGSAAALAKLLGGGALQSPPAVADAVEPDAHAAICTLRYARGDMHDAVCTGGIAHALHALHTHCMQVQARGERSPTSTSAATRWATRVRRRSRRRCPPTRRSPCSGCTPTASATRAPPRSRPHCRRRCCATWDST